MKLPKKSQRWWLMIAVFALVASACSGSTLDTTTTSAAAGESTTTAENGETTTTVAPGTPGAMTVTVDLDPDAVWSDGTPVTAEDFVCTHQAFLNTPGSLSTIGYAEMLSVAAGESDKQVVIEFAEVYAPYKTVFNQILPAHLIDDCSDISADFLDSVPVSARPWLLQEVKCSLTHLVPESHRGQVEARSSV